MSVLTEQLLSDIADRKSLDELEDVEIIFQPITRLGGLEKCQQLRSLSVIFTGLTEISNLEPVGRTLLELNLTDQQLTHISGLDALPHLRRLFLHRNQITKIENLDNCSQLETLWLSSNRITSIENLQNLGCLQELWLQDNRIKHLRNLEYLGNLNTLALAGNPLKTFESIHNVARLPQLQDLSLSDTMFDNCPVTQAEGYRAFVLCSIMHLEVLDGHSVTPEECRASRDLQRHHLREFNQRIQIASDEAEREINQIRAQRARQKNSAREMNKILMESFNDLEACIMAGRRKIQETLEQDAKVREAARQGLNGALLQLQNDFESDINALQRRQEALFKRQQSQLAATKRRTAVEYHLSTSLSRLAARGIIATLLQPTAPEFRTLTKALRAATDARAGGGLRVLRGYTLFSESKLGYFRSRVAQAQGSQGGGPNTTVDSVHTQDIRVVYAALPIPSSAGGDVPAAGGCTSSFHDLVADNLIPSGAGADAAPLLLFADPLKAFRHATAVAPAGKGPFAYSAVFECQFFLNVDTHVLCSPSSLDSSGLDVLAHLKPQHVSAQFQLLEVDDSAAGAPATSKSTAALPHDAATVYAVRTDTTNRAHLLLQACVLCEVSSAEGSESSKSNSRSSQEGSKSAEEFLSTAVLPQHVYDPRLRTRVEEFQQALDDQCNEFQKKLLFNLDPQSASKLQEATNHLKQARADVKNLRRQVEHEREQQKQILSKGSQQ